MILKWLLRRWQVNDTLPAGKVDVIVAISYGATMNRLTHGSRAVMRQVMTISTACPEAIIAWGSFSGNPMMGAEEVAKKRELGRRAQIFIGQVSSTTEECLATKRTLEIAGMATKNIVVISEGCHSRRCKMVWEYFFPQSRICMKPASALEAEDRENPMFFQRGWRRWLIVNIIGLVIFKVVGVGRMAKWNFSQPSTR